MKSLKQLVEEYAEKAGIRVAVTEEKGEPDDYQEVVSLETCGVYVGRWEETSPANFKGTFYDVYTFDTHPGTRETPPDCEVVEIVNRVNECAAMTEVLKFVVAERVQSHYLSGHEEDE